MYKLVILIFSIVFFSTKLIGQTPIDVTESTIKVGWFGEEILYYGFAEGDQVIFNFQEVDGKKLKEFEITELPANSKFKDYKVTKIENKTLYIPRTGIYKFRFSNSGITSRMCKFRIQRIPASNATKNFNPVVYWRTGYDTTYTTEQERYLIGRDTAIVNITDQVAKVHSQTNVNGNKTTFNFNLPNNTIAWSYYIGVNQAGQQAYQTATQKLVSSVSPIVSKIPGYGPLAVLALGGVSYISTLQSGEDIDFYIVDGYNLNYFLTGKQFSYVKRGKVINDFSRMLSPLSGDYHLCLANDNAVTGVSVSVKITAITVKEQWGLRFKQRPHLLPKLEAYLKN